MQAYKVPTPHNLIQNSGGSLHFVDISCRYSGANGITLEMGGPRRTLMFCSRSEFGGNLSSLSLYVSNKLYNHGHYNNPSCMNLVEIGVF